MNNSKIDMRNLYENREYSSDDGTYVLKRDLLTGHWELIINGKLIIRHTYRAEIAQLYNLNLLR